MILAGRAINDGMPRHVAQMTIKSLNSLGKVIKGARVLIMGLTYKENVPDIRETPVKGIISELQEYEVELFGYDPLVSDINAEFGIIREQNPLGKQDFDAVIVTVGHDIFRELTIEQIKSIMSKKPLLIDVRGIFSDKEAAEAGILYRTL